MEIATSKSFSTYVILKAMKLDKLFKSSETGEVDETLQG